MSARIEIESSLEASSIFAQSANSVLDRGDGSWGDRDGWSVHNNNSFYYDVTTAVPSWQPRAVIMLL